MHHTWNINSIIFCSSHEPFYCLGWFLCFGELLWVETCSLTGVKDEFPQAVSAAERIYKHFDRFNLQNRHLSYLWKVHLGMQLPIAGLIAHLHAQFRKAQLKFSPGLSNTNFLPWNWHFKEHQVARTPDLLFISRGRQLFSFPS